PWAAGVFGDGGGGAGAAAASLVTEIWACSAMLLALGSAAVDRRLLSVLWRIALACAAAVLCHVMLAPLGLFRAIIESLVFVACGTLLGCIPLGDIVARVKAVLF